MRFLPVGPWSLRFLICSHNRSPVIDKYYCIRRQARAQSQLCRARVFRVNRYSNNVFTAF